MENLRCFQEISIKVKLASYSNILYYHETNHEQAYYFNGSAIQYCTVCTKDGGAGSSWCDSTVELYTVRLRAVQYSTVQYTVHFTTVV